MYRSLINIFLELEFILNKGKKIQNIGNKCGDECCCDYIIIK